MKDTKLYALADLALSKKIDTKKIVKIERCSLSLDVDDFHIIAKAVKVYLALLEKEDPPSPKQYVERVVAIDNFFQKGGPL